MRAMKKAVQFFGVVAVAVGGLNLAPAVAKAGDVYVGGYRPGYHGTGFRPGYGGSRPGWGWGYRPGGYRHGGFI